jgi:hypothetical protein
VLLVDAGVGLLLFLVGVWVSVAWSVVAGAFLEATGILYVILVGRRWRRWSALRRIMLDGVDG